MFAALALIVSTAPRLIETIDARRFLREMGNVPAQDLPAAIQRSTDTEIGQLLSGVIKISEDSQKQLLAIFAEVDDPALAHVLEPSTLGDKTSRDAALAIIVAKQKIITGLRARTNEVYTEMATKISGLSMDFNRRHSEKAGSSVITGMNQTLPKAREIIEAYIADLGVFYAGVADLIRFLDTPGGASTPVQDKLYFATDKALTDFKQRASRIDADRAKLLQDAGAMQQMYQRGLENMQRGFTEQ
jgi:hypothetical protein